MIIYYVAFFSLFSSSFFLSHPSVNTITTHTQKKKKRLNIL